MTVAGSRFIFAVMLQHNATKAGRAHLAHAAVVSLHALCCGLPALLMMAAAVSGAASGVVVLSSLASGVHGFLHAHEPWLIGLSAALVAVGGGLEAAMRRGGRVQGFPWLFGLSVVCFLANLAIIAAHRGF